MKCSALGGGFCFGWKKFIIVITIIIIGFLSGLLHQNWLFLTFPHSATQQRTEISSTSPPEKSQATHRLKSHTTSSYSLPGAIWENPDLLLHTGEISETHFLKPAPCPDLHLHLGLIIFLRQL